MDNRKYGQKREEKEKSMDGERVLCKLVTDVQVPSIYSHKRKKEKQKIKEKADHKRLHDTLRQTPNGITITLFTHLNISCFGYTF